MAAAPHPAAAPRAVADAVAATIPPRTRAVLLDGLGTLLELAPPWPALVERLRCEYGLHVEPAAAARAFRAEIAYYRAHHHEGRDARSLGELRARCAEVLRAGLPEAVGARLGSERLTAAMLDALRFSPYPDAAPALAALRGRGLRLVVVSNWDVSLSEVLRATGLAELLDGVVTSAAVGAPKPAPAIFAAALARAGVAAGQAVHVGDSLEHDVRGARAAGIAAVLVRRGGGAATGAAPGGAGRGEAPADVVVIASLAELLA